MTLRGVLAESAKPDNAVFRLLSTRLGEALALFVRNDVETGKDTVARCVPNSESKHGNFGGDG